MCERPKRTRIAKPAGLYREEQQGEGQLRPVPELEKFRVGGGGVPAGRTLYQAGTEGC